MNDTSATSHPSLADIASPSATSPGPVRHRLTLWLTTTAILIVVIGWFVHRSQTDILEFTRLIGHTNEVLNRLNLLQSSVDLVLLDQRTYFLSGREDYLDRARVGLHRLPSEVDRVRFLTEDNPQQQARIVTLAESLEVFRETLTRLTKLYRAKGVDAIRDNLIDETDMPNDRALQARIQAMIQTETRLLKLWEEAVVTASRQSMYAGIACVFMLSAGLMGVYVILARESRQRQQSMHDVQRINAQLADSLARLRQLTRDTTLVGTLGDYLQSCQSREEAFQLLARYLPELFPDASGSVSLMSDRPGWLESVLCWGDEQSLGMEFHADDCWGLRRGRLHVAGDAETRDPVCRHVAADGVHSCLCTPMAAHGQTLGLLTLQPTGHARMERSRQRIAAQVAEQMSMALANLTLQEALRFQSERDALTGLYNRRFMEAALERELSRSRRLGTSVAVVMIDIDHFKRFNDTKGHEAGDVLLAEFGKMIGRCVRGEDIACRYGGEEFCLILPGASVEAAVRRAEELCEATRQLSPKFKGNALGPVTISAGVSGHDGRGEPDESLVAQADAALYQAKRAGRDRVMDGARTRVLGIC